MNKEQKTIMKRAKETAKGILSTKGMKKKDREAEAAKVLNGADKDVQALEIRRTGNGILKDAHCIICEKKINNGDYRILGFKDDKMIYRHEACAPGSVKWMKSSVGQASRWRKYFKEVREVKEDV